MNVVVVIGTGYRRMIELSAAGRAGTPDELGTVGAHIMDGGVTAAYWFGKLAPQ